MRKRKPVATMRYEYLIAASRDVIALVRQLVESVVRGRILLID